MLPFPSKHSQTKNKANRPFTEPPQTLKRGDKTPPQSTDSITAIVATDAIPTPNTGNGSVTVPATNPHAGISTAAPTWFELTQDDMGKSLVANVNWMLKHNEFRNEVLVPTPAIDLNSLRHLGIDDHDCVLAVQQYTAGRNADETCHIYKIDSNIDAIKIPNFSL